MQPVQQLFTLNVFFDIMIHFQSLIYNKTHTKTDIKTEAVHDWAGGTIILEVGHRGTCSDSCILKHKGMDQTKGREDARDGKCSST